MKISRSRVLLTFFFLSLRAREIKRVRISIVLSLDHFKGFHHIRIDNRRILLSMNHIYQ